MTIKDVASRLNISHQAVRARIAKSCGQAAGNYTTSSGDLTEDGLRLVADLYFSGDLSALTDETQDEPTNGEIERLTAEIEQLKSENEQLRSELDRVRSEAQTAVVEHARQIVDLTGSFTESLAAAHRLADQAQQLHAQAIIKPLPWYRRLLGEKTK
jgi:outer membrane murein-binding lipoprotein Lpp